MNLNLQNKKIELIQWLSTLTDESVIEKLVSIRQNHKDTSWEALSDEERVSIEKGLEDMKNGKVIPHSKARELYEKWL